MKVYIAGPMRGIPEYNIPAFDEATRKWQEMGHMVYSPAALVRAMPYGPQKNHPIDEDRQRAIHIAQMDLGCLYHCDAIALLPGWENSMGAAMELALAQFLGLDIYDAVTMQQIDPDRKPWNEIKAYQATYDRDPSHFSKGS